jgi:hypothetical protein
MMVRVYWLIRVTGFAVIGILALISPPHSTVQQAVQIACFSVVGLALLAWIAADVRPRPALSRSGWPGGSPAVISAPWPGIRC